MRDLSQHAQGFAVAGVLSAALGAWAVAYAIVADDLELGAIGYVMASWLAGAVGLVCGCLGVAFGPAPRVRMLAALAVGLSGWTLALNLVGMGFLR